MKLLMRVIIIGILLCLAIGTITIVKGYIMYKEAIEDKPLKELIQEIQAKESYTKIENLPETYVNAVIAVEDHRFYQHKGIDIIAIGRAIINDIKAKELVEGGSTITQQLAKNIYFSLNKNFDRKIAELFITIDLEKNYSKEEIFELYVNTSYFGDGYYSVKEASLGYFNKEPIDMTDYESTMLAGIPNAPSVYAPTQNLDLAEQRQKQVISKMIEYNYITEEEADKIL